MANIVTSLRVGLAFFILMIVKINPLWNLIAIILIAIAMLMDALDGFLAKHLNTASVNGSIYDILADRIIENIFFIYFASHSFFSVWIPIFVMTRSLIIDAIRTIFLASGKTAFGKSTLHSHTWTIFLACSRISRGLYNALKIFTFMSFSTLLMNDNFLLHVLHRNTLLTMAYVFLWSTICLSLLRAIPVLFDGCHELNILPHRNRATAGQNPTNSLI